MNEQEEYYGLRMTFQIYTRRKMNISSIVVCIVTLSHYTETYNR